MAESIFDLGETSIITCTIKDEDGNLTDPNSIVLTITVNGTTKVDEQAMTKDSQGNYHYDYLTDTSGRHDVTIKATQTSPSRITIQKDTFMVV